MAPESVLALKKKATSLGMERSAALKANRKQLEDFIANAGKSGSANGAKKKATATKAVKKAVTKKATTTKAVAKKSTATKPATRKAAATKPKATTRRAAKPSEDETGRATIGEIDWTETENWNPRVGGPTERMFKALKKFKGNVDKAFDFLSGDLYEFVHRNKNDGTKRTKAEAEAMLRYRLNRTKFQFAVQTGQHEIATNRVEYGTGSRAQETKKASRSRSRTTPAKARTTAKASTTKRTTKTAAQKRRTAGTKRR